MLGMTLSYLGSQTTICQLAIQFGVMTDAFIHYREMIMKVLIDIADSIIKWPSKDEYQYIADHFNKRRVRLVSHVKILLQMKTFEQ